MINEAINKTRRFTGDDIENSVRPRDGESSERPGAYNIVTVGNVSVVDPGQMLAFEQYVTGYGEVGAGKVVVFLSPDLIDVKKSTIHHSIGIIDSQLEFGVTSYPIEENSFAFTFGGLKAVKWKSSTLFFDSNNSNPPFLITEKSIGKKNRAPFSYNIKLRKDIKPGDYSMDFYFTYFNGDKWNCVKEQVKFKVRNIFERHAVKFSYLAVAATLTGIANVIIRLFGEL